MAPGSLDEVPSDTFQPDGIIPFAIAEVDARDRAVRRIRRTWLPPFGLERHARTNSVKGVYLPFWAFDAHAIGYWAGGGVTRGIIEMDFGNLLVCADRGIDSNAIPTLESPPAKAIRAYDARVVDGWPVASAQRGLDEATLLAHTRMEHELAATTKRSRPPKERDKVLLSRVEYARENCKRLLLPIWLLDYRYLGRSYRIVIDGSSGVVTGEVPTSTAKVALAMIAILWIILFLGDAETALSIPVRMAEGVRWLVRRSPSS
ncbi:MAG TPA: hypothetical protein VGL25_07215 [Casimicrobiaceae bacterium]|jgi:hypothetical protein